MLVLVAGAPLASRAQDDEEAEEPVPVHRLPPTRVTAVRMAELPDAPSSFATVIDADEHRGETKQVEDLLARSVGVQVRRFGGPGAGSEISIRGSSSDQVVVRLDGVRINTAQSGTVDLSTLPLSLVDRVEVARGGGGTLVGSGAIGGVVDVHTRTPGAEPETDATFSGGSFGTFEGSLHHAARRGDLDYLLGYSGFHTDGDWDFRSVEIQTQDGFDVVPSRKLERINNEVDRHALLLKGGYEISDDLRLELMDNLFYVSRGQPGPDDRPQDPNGGQNPDAHERRARNVTALHFEADDLPGDLRARAQLSYLYERTHYRDPAPDLGPPIDTRQRNRSGGSRVTLEAEHRPLGGDHLGTLALEQRYDSLSSNEQGFHRRHTFGAALQDEIAWLDSRVSLVPALRFDYTDDFGSEWVPRLGLVLSPVSWLRLKANVERSYRVPDFDELYFPDKGYIRGNPNLDPEKALDLDAGLEFGIAEWLFLSDLRLQTAFFHDDIKNSIVFQRINPQTIAPTNTRDATVYGVELAGSFSLFAWVELSGNFTWQHAELDRARVTSVLEQPGTALPGRAEREYTLRARLGPPSGLVKLVIERSHTSSIPINFNDQASVSGRTVWDASASLDLMQLWRPHWSLAPKSLVASIAATNFTDESVRDSVGFPQPGRSLTFEIAGRW